MKDMRSITGVSGIAVSMPESVKDSIDSMQKKCFDFNKKVFAPVDTTAKYYNSTTMKGVIMPQYRVIDTAYRVNSRNPLYQQGNHEPRQAKSFYVTCKVQRIESAE